MLSLLRQAARLSLPPLVRCSSSSSSASLPSRVYPGLFYHPSPLSPDSYSLSYLPSPPPSLAFSPTTLGLVHPLPSSSSSSSSSSFDKPPEGQQTEDDGLPPITPRNFQENPLFLRLVQDVLQANVAGDLWLQTQAKSMEGNDTFIHISDLRSPADANRQPHPQDIIGSVLVQKGQIEPESFEPNKAAYRLVSEDGLMRLPEGLQGKLVEACRRVREVEVEVKREKEEAEGGQ
ncbi:hypothetical protein JCM8547_000557 [Rhodosporidiobolus lusitaniae]